MNFQMMLLITHKRIVWRRQTIESENIHQVVKLAMNVPANGELGFIRNVHVHHGGLLDKQLLYVQQDLNAHMPN